MATNRGFVVDVNGGDSGTGDRRRVIRLNRGQTGNVSLVTTTIRPGVLVPPHIHEHEDEVWYVVSGAAMVMLGDDLHRAEAGSTVWRPKGQYHASWVPNDAGDAEIITVLWPGGWEQRIKEFDREAAGGEFDEAAFVAMARSNGVIWDFDRGRVLAKEYGLRLMGERA